MAGHDVFISYSTLDKRTADAVCHGLEAEGVRCWIAPRDVTPGMDWQQSLLDAIAEAKAVVLIFTGNANTSANVHKEVTAAFEGGAVVIPFRLEEVEPQGSLRYHLTGVHWMDAMSPPLEQHVRSLAYSVRRVLDRNDEREAAPEPAPPPPPQPRPAPPDALPDRPSTSRPLGLVGGAIQQPSRPSPASGGMPSWIVPAAIGGGVVAVVLFIGLIIAGINSSNQTNGAGGNTNTAVITTNGSTGTASTQTGGTPATIAAQPSPERVAAVNALRTRPEPFQEIDSELQPLANGTPTTIQGGTVITTQQLVLTMANPQHLPQLTLIDALGCGSHASIPTARCAAVTDNIAQLLNTAQVERDAPIVFFCHGPDCPNSYVMAQAAIGAGFTNVFWYRGGMRAWQSLPTAPTAPPTPLNGAAQPAAPAQSQGDGGLIVENPPA